MKNRAFLLAAVGSTILWAAAAGALQICPDCLHHIHTWPTDGAPCDAGSTLQACIDSASSGDTVQIATNTPIDEALTIQLVQESLTLTAAPGFHPSFSSFDGIFVTSESGSNSITIEGLTLTSSGINVLQDSTDPLMVAIGGNTMSVTSASDAGAIRVESATNGMVAFDISSNVIESTRAPQGAPCIDFESENASGRIASNTISIAGDETHVSDAIDVAGITLSVDLIANRISGTQYEEGISLVDVGGGSATARVLDNLVTGGSDGSGVLLSAKDGSISSSVINNTLDDNAVGVLIIGPGAATVENNAITGSSGIGLEFDPNETDVSNQNNLYFGNATDLSSGNTPVPPGPNSVFAAPLYVDAPHGNYHLQASSPAIDAGDDAAVPADLTTDLDGSPRIQGAHVDIGAYETAPEPDARVLAVTGLVALLGLGRGRGTTAFRSPARRG